MNAANPALLGAAMVAAVWATPLFAADDPAFAEHASAAAFVGDDELADLRGGFSLDGVDVKLGAEIRSYLHDELVLQTNISWSADGPAVTRFVSGTLSEASASGLRDGLISGTGITMNTGGETLYLGNDGQTAFLHRVGDSIQNVVVNTANGADVRQEMDVTIDLSNFAPLQSVALSNQITSALASEMMATVLGGDSF